MRGGRLPRDDCTRNQIDVRQLIAWHPRKEPLSYEAMSSVRRRIVSLFTIIVAVLAVAFVSPSIAIADMNTQDSRENHPAPGERALIGRLVAPCCWQQTLDVHSGPVADALRAEVRTRLWAGETAREIEADFVARYGSRVRGVPDGNAVAGVSLGLIVSSFFAAVGVFILMFRWRRAAHSSTLPAKSATSRDAYDDRIDDELDATSP